MKKLLFWLALMVGIVALIGSCAKKDESTTTAAAVTSTTASGSITFWKRKQCQEPTSVPVIVVQK